MLFSTQVFQIRIDNTSLFKRRLEIYEVGKESSIVHLL